MPMPGNQLIDERLNFRYVRKGGYNKSEFICQECGKKTVNETLHSLNTMKKYCEPCIKERQKRRMKNYKLKHKGGK